MAASTPGVAASTRSNRDVRATSAEKLPHMASFQFARGMRRLSKNDAPSISPTSRGGFRAFRGKNFQHGPSLDPLVKQTVATGELGNRPHRRNGQNRNRQTSCSTQRPMYYARVMSFRLDSGKRLSVMKEFDKRVCGTSNDIGKILIENAGGAAGSAPLAVRLQNKTRERSLPQTRQKIAQARLWKRTVSLK